MKKQEVVKMNKLEKIDAEIVAAMIALKNNKVIEANENLEKARKLLNGWPYSIAEIIRYAQYQLNDILKQEEK